jgi:GrpB-like predicted nucleotidyltransferase (UPF0157 family)
MNTDPRERMLELLHERITVTPYDRRWPVMYAEEEAFLHSALPADLVIRIDHIGSTAVEGCSAKPIVDIQVEVKSLERVRTEVVPAMEGHGYEFIWRASIGEHSPFYAWFIRRDEGGTRTHHIHMVEPDMASEDRILFRDHLRRHPAEVLRYEKLKHALSEAYPNDRDSYTKGKSDFIRSVVHHIREQRS